MPISVVSRLFLENANSQSCDDLHYAKASERNKLKATASTTTVAEMETVTAAAAGEEIMHECKEVIKECVHSCKMCAEPWYGCCYTALV